ncbi:ParM/StbA family protein [Metabacillus fastidiosus]|uniref:ParM/StbA family protein n=1 Tax=Metabacillus fastidiosus TaxID=1458 RepID=UPI002E1C9D88|nr:ParM/StbA family protein [Metabacillus fastidiosus]
MKVILANDIGNDKMKILEPGMKDVVKIPSAYKRLMKTPPCYENDVNKNVANLIDQLLVHITSTAIKRDGTYIVGERAIQTTEEVSNMNIVSHEKHTAQLPLINTLAYVAARAVQKDFKENGSLSTNLDVDVMMSSAIPASQHTVDTAKVLEDRFMNGEHLVVVYVGAEKVTVKLKFKKVKVTKEGIPALYAIFEAPEDMFKEFAKEYKISDVKGKYFADKKIMHTDIGSGTTEYIYSIGVNARPEQCTGSRLGVGHAVAKAIELMKDERPGLSINRQQFAKYIEQPEQYSKDYILAKECLEEARINQVDFILEDVETKYISTLSSEPEIIACYGGGSIEFKADMYQDLKEFADSVNAKVLWIPAKYAVDMNVRGLAILNKNIWFKEEYKEVVKS